MAWQLIFTSAAAGLQPGSFGYCTVARSASIREAVASRLEQLSVYTHTTSGVQPVICAHRLLVVGRSTYHVLSRLVDSGVDYTGRTNFLAHHLVLQEFELSEASSPADIFLHWAGWLTQWPGTPRLLSADEDVLDLRVAGATPLPAETWKAAVGDAAGATWLVNDTGSGAQTANLSVSPGWEAEWLLALYAESLRLLDPKGTSTAVWGVPFTTYLQEENDAQDFQWRGAWQPGQFHGLPGTLVDFELQHFPQVPRGGAMASLARTGMKLEVKIPVAASSSQGEALPGNHVPHTASGHTVPASFSRQQSRPVQGRKWLPIAGGISLSLIVASGALVGWLLRQGTKQSEPPVTHHNSLSQQISLDTPTAMPLPSISTILTATSTPPPSEDPEHARANKARKEQEDRLSAVKIEVAKIPEGTTCFSVDSTKSMNVPPEAVPELNKLLQDLHNQSGNPIADIELHRNSFTTAPDPETQVLSAFFADESNTLKARPNPKDTACEITDKLISITNDPVTTDFVWIVIKPKLPSIKPMNFVLASNREVLSTHGPRLPRHPFVDAISSPNTIKVQPDTFALLRERFTGWQGLDAWTDNSQAVQRVVLQARLSNPSEQVASNSEFEIHLPDSLALAENRLKTADADYRQIRTTADKETERARTIYATQKRLSSLALPEAVHKKFKDLKKLSDGIDGSTCYSTFGSWLAEINKTNPNPAEAQAIESLINQHDHTASQIQNRYDVLVDLLKSLSQETEGAGHASPADQIMHVLVTYIQQNLHPEDEVFFEYDEAEMKALPQSLQRKNKEVASAEAKLNAARRDKDQARPASERLVAVWLCFRITTKKSGINPLIPFIEFVSERASSVQ